MAKKRGTSLMDVPIQVFVWWLAWEKLRCPIKLVSNCIAKAEANIEGKVFANSHLNTYRKISQKLKLITGSFVCLFVYLLFFFFLKTKLIAIPNWFWLFCTAFGHKSSASKNQKIWHHNGFRLSYYCYTNLALARWRTKFCLHYCMY